MQMKYLLLIVALLVLGIAPASAGEIDGKAIQCDILGKYVFPNILVFEDGFVYEWSLPNHPTLTRKVKRTKLSEYKANSLTIRWDRKLTHSSWYKYTLDRATLKMNGGDCKLVNINTLIERDKKEMERLIATENGKLNPKKIKNKGLLCKTVGILCRSDDNFFACWLKKLRTLWNQAYTGFDARGNKFTEVFGKHIGLYFPSDDLVYVYREPDDSLVQNISRHEFSQTLSGYSSIDFGPTIHWVDEEHRKKDYAYDSYELNRVDLTLNMHTHNSPYGTMPIRAECNLLTSSSPQREIEAFFQKMIDLIIKERKVIRGKNKI